MENLKIEEEFISGFCRTCNMGQTVCCEYTIQDNEKTLSFMDCAHERCVNTGACEIYRQAKGTGMQIGYMKIFKIKSWSDTENWHCPFNCST